MCDDDSAHCKWQVMAALGWLAGIGREGGVKCKKKTKRENKNVKVRTEMKV